jgi:hypothetical protein
VSTPNCPTRAEWSLLTVGRLLEQPSRPPNTRSTQLRVMLSGTMRQASELGKEVRVVADAPAANRSGARAWIVGIRDDPHSDQQLLTVEFEDGSSIEIAADLVEDAS